MPQRSMVVFSAQWAFSIFELLTYIYIYIYIYIQIFLKNHTIILSSTPGSSQWSSSFSFISSRFKSVSHLLQCSSLACLSSSTAYPYFHLQGFWQRTEIKLTVNWVVERIPRTVVLNMILLVQCPQKFDNLGTKDPNFRAVTPCQHFERFDDTFCLHL